NDHAHGDRVHRQADEHRDQNDDNLKPATPFQYPTPAVYVRTMRYSRPGGRAVASKSGVTRRRKPRVTPSSPVGGSFVNKLLGEELTGVHGPPELVAHSTGPTFLPSTTESLAKTSYSLRVPSH